MSIKEDIAANTAKASPPVAVTFLDVIGVHLNEILVVLTLIYTVVMVVYTVYKFVWEVIDRRRKERERARLVELADQFNMDGQDRG
jgi:hypothetical protein